MTKTQRCVGVRRTLAMGAAAAVGAALLAAAPAPAAAAGCYGSDCKWQDPYAMGCADDAVMAGLAYVQTGTGTGRVEHWHSPGCMADWATTRVYSGPTDAVMAGIQQQGEGTYTTGVSSDTVRHDMYTYPWVVTPMIDGSVANCAIGTVTNTGHEPYAKPACA